MPATDQLLQPIPSCDIPAADQQSVLIVPTSSMVTPPSSTAGATDHSELAAPTTTGAPSHHNYSLHPISPKSGEQRVHVLDISPYPTCKQAERRRNKSQKAEVLTSSPYKKALEEKSMQPKPVMLVLGLGP